MSPSTWVALALVLMIAGLGLLVFLRKQKARERWRAAAARAHAAGAAMHREVVLALEAAARSPLDADVWMRARATVDRFVLTVAGLAEAAPTLESRQRISGIGVDAQLLQEALSAGSHLATVEGRSAVGRCLAALEPALDWLRLEASGPQSQAL